MGGGEVVAFFFCVLIGSVAGSYHLCIVAAASSEIDPSLLPCLLNSFESHAGLEFFFNVGPLRRPVTVYEFVCCMCWSVPDAGLVAGLARIFSMTLWLADFNATAY